MPAEAALVAYLDTVLTETAGSTLFEGPAPEQPDDLLALTQYDSLEAEDRIMAASGVDQQAVWPVMVQVMARNALKASAEARCRAVFDALDNLGPVSLGGVTYHSIEAAGEPFNLGQDPNGRWRWACNFRVEKGRG